MTLKVGCCGFPVAKPVYFSALPVVEVQQTFYQPPQEKTLKAWREQAPADFEFTLKAWQLITHPATSPTYRRLRKPPSAGFGDPPLHPAKPENYGSFRPTDEVFAAWQITAAAGRALGAKVVVFQCSASFTPSAANKANLRAFFRAIERADFIFAWEPRGEWQPKEIQRVCEELGLIDCVDPFLRIPTYGEILYFRLHGKKGYRYRYTDEDLAWLREFLVRSGAIHCASPSVMNHATTSGYCLFNNLSMWEDAQRFLGLLSEFSPGRQVAQ